MYRKTQARIDTSALRHNLNLLRQWNGEDFFCPMVKANAYGHGELLIARAAEETGVSALGVALIEEGARLREAGVRAPILTFAPFGAEGAEAILRHGLTPVVTRFADLAALARVRGRATNEPVAIHLKFNTGMQRLGFDAADLPRLRAELKEQAWLEVRGCCTHLAHGEDAAMISEDAAMTSEDAAHSSPTSAQLRKLRALSEGFPGVRHAHKSASLAALGPRAAGDGIGARPGIGIYGLPHDGREVGAGLRPVLTWQTEITHVHTVEKGEAVGYSSRWIAPRRSQIGVVPMGYGDGYLRALSNKSFMLCRGARVPVVGSVCMDYTFVDLTEISGPGAVQPGEAVVALGRQGGAEVSAADLAEWAGTIAYEVVTAISARVAREAV